MPSLRTITLCIAAGGTLFAAAYAFAATRTDEQDFSQIAKGRYLTVVADCVACHTVPNSGRLFAGGRPIETPFGILVSPNITPDRDTGIGVWTDEQFDNAVRHGVRPDGSRLYPAMPYPSYTKMSRKDVLAIRAYLRTLRPVRNPVVANHLPFPFNIRLAMRAWDAMFFKPGDFHPDPQKSAEWNRGAFLVEGPAHCGACHTPKNILGADKSDQYLRGFNLQGWFAPDITNDSRTGLGSWSTDDVVAYLKTGHNRIGGATGPMAEEIVHSSSRMTDDDLKAIATYLKSLPGRGDNPSPVAASDPAMQAGAAIYRDQCSACHQIDGKGVPALFPALASSSVARSDDPQTLLHLILRGSRSVATKDEPTAPGMPSYSWQLDNDQVAAVATYVRNAWGNAAPAVTAAQVDSARKKLSLRPD